MAATRSRIERLSTATKLALTLRSELLVQAPPLLRKAPVEVLMNLLAFGAATVLVVPSQIPPLARTTNWLGVVAVTVPTWLSPQTKLPAWVARACLPAAKE